MSDFSPILIADVTDAEKDTESYYPGTEGISLTSFIRTGVNIQRARNVGFRVEASFDRVNWRQIFGWDLGNNIGAGPTICTNGECYWRFVYSGPCGFLRVWVLYVDTPNRFKALLSRRR
jgi:hypothetical protein